MPKYKVKKSKKAGQRGSKSKGGKGGKAAKGGSRIGRVIKAVKGFIVKRRPKSAREKTKTKRKFKAGGRSR